MEKTVRDFKLSNLIDTLNLLYKDLEKESITAKNFIAGYYAYISAIEIPDLSKEEFEMLEVLKTLLMSTLNQNLMLTEVTEYNANLLEFILEKLDELKVQDNYR